MSRVTSAEKIAAARAEGRPALIGYLPAGFPDVETSIEAAVALAENGVDVIEMGIPYSDPVMDGLVIQEATNHALANGFRVAQIFDIVRGITERTDAAVMVMTYWNPVLRLGVDEFARRFAEAGGAGLITPDLVPDEAAEWQAASEKYDLERVFLIAPSSTEARVKQTVAASSGFVYCVSLMGVTGARSEVSSAAQAVVDAAHAAGAANACVGLGVSRREHVTEIGGYADGVIVGTALVAALRDGGVPAVGRLAAELSGRA
ncbi:tryptophan synthase subunit alpha [Arthrobacter sp. MYb211]|uniref:tryptophan synthase subunit alpha n=1 Tax=Micrococcaceae TaxID=1268 RepID=UPI000BB9A21C|nr:MULTISPECIES: tryptophan synthase subunit alpha [Micrococcaceae]PCC29368.1 tryptophan synthase subunit alpha [Glutamicibacter sp. BW80]PRA01378.1 tryptophan synthase subunit alpha [Arthrobacter sp. MYb224]PRA06430.1 tryptophan synthase subunit alpha [Arthrobacter sp. MYb229]PRA12638.1 tryptophan synthase subunit alpha [Arthrobacter sp. MYb221]PRB53332.1 tryptophan synthase subunit alpha [Arthrobacter sp. MYb216]